MTRCGLIMAFLIFAIATNAQHILAHEFRIETEVYVGGQNEPVSQNLTLFSDPLIYDFQMSSDAKPKPLEIVIFNTRDKSFVLLDIERGIRLELQQVQIVQMVEGLRQQTSQSDLAKFLVEDNFEEEADLAAGWVTLTNTHMEYRFKGKPPQDVSIIPAYYEFLDQYTRLNASDPTKLPPFPRLRLNQSIKKFGWIPSEVRVTLNANGLIKSKIELKSEHTLVNSLSNKDRERISQAKTAWMSSKAVNLAKYRGLTKQPRLAEALQKKKVLKGVEHSAK